jgi:hypothetical protein
MYFNSLISLFLVNTPYSFNTFAIHTIFKIFEKPPSSINSSTKWFELYTATDPTIN